jgi:hypothetical protein
MAQASLTSIELDPMVIGFVDSNPGPAVTAALPSESLWYFSYSSEPSFSKEIYRIRAKEFRAIRDILISQSLIWRHWISHSHYLATASDVTTSINPL